MRVRPSTLLMTGVLLINQACSGEPANTPLPPRPQPDPTDPGTIQIAPSATYQTISGWEATWYAMNESPAFGAFIDPLLDRVVNEVGINRIRLSVRSGSESDEDYWSRWQAGEIPYERWREMRYATVNDNDNPLVVDPTGFHFSELDESVARVVVPMQRLLEARGERLYVTLLYVAFTTQITDARYVHDDPEEYAEFILATFRHLEETYDLVPDGLEILLEPDNVPEWNAELMGQAILRVKDRLASAGYRPDIIAPSTTKMSAATDYARSWLESGGVVEHVQTLSYHRYRGFSDQDLTELAGLAAAEGLQTAMLEWWDDKNGYATLHQDLEVGMNSAWEHGSLAGNSPMDLYRIDDSDPARPVISLGEKARYTRQYFLYVRRGATRIGAATANAMLDPLAFINADGRHVLVVMADRAEEFTVSGLPPGTYGATYATESEWGASLPDQAIGAGDLLSLGMPGRGVLTVFAR